MRINYRLIAFVGIVAALSLTCNASASILSLLQSGPNQASDEDREYLIDNDFSTAGAPGFGIVGQIDVGDVFRGHIDFNTLNSGGANVGGLTGENELSGVFQVLVTGKAALGGGVFSFTFGPDPGFAEGGVAGAMIALWEDATPDFAADYNSPPPAAIPGGLVHDDGALHPPHTPPPSTDVSVGPYADENAFIGTAVDGTRFATFGFDGSAGEGFSAFSTGGDNVLPFFAITSGSGFAFNNFSMSRLDGPGVETFDIITLGPTVGTFGPIVGIVGSQQLRGVSDLDTSFEISTNTNVSFNVTRIVPEPLSLVVWLGLITGLVATARTRKRNV